MPSTALNSKQSVGIYLMLLLVISLIEIDFQPQEMAADAIQRLKILDNGTLMCTYFDRQERR